MSETAILKVSFEFDEGRRVILVKHPLMIGSLSFPCASEEAGKTMLNAMSQGTIQEIIAAKEINPVEAILSSISEIRDSISTISKAVKG